jgi:hypothetical protein
LLFYWRVLRRVTRHHALGFVFFTLAALYTHLATYPMVAALGLYHLLFGWRTNRTTWARVLVLFALVGVLTLPWLLVVYFKLGQGQIIGQTSLWLPITAFLPAFGNRVGVLLVATIIFAGWQVRAAGFYYAAFVVAATMVITVALNAASPFLFHMRHLVGLLPVFYVVCGVGATAALAQYPRITGALMAVWVCAGVWNSYDPRYMLATPGHEPAIPTQAMNTLVFTAENCIGADDVAILYIGEVERHGDPWEWINDVVMVYYWRDVPFKFAHLNTLDPITNDDPMGEDPQTPITDLTAYPPKATQFINGANRVWLIKLKRLPDVQQQQVLAQTLTLNGYTEAQTVINTDFLIGTVYETNSSEVTCSEPR